MLVLLLISRIVLEYIKAIPRPTKTDVGRQRILMVCLKIKTIFFSFCLFRLLKKFIVMSQTMNKILWHRKKYWQSQLFTKTQGYQSIYLSIYLYIYILQLQDAFIIARLSLSSLLSTSGLSQ